MRFCSCTAVLGKWHQLWWVVWLLRWASLCRLQFHYGFVGKLVYLLITYTGGFGCADPKSAAKVTQVTLYRRRGRMKCLRGGGNANAKCEIKLWDPIGIRITCSQVLFLVRCASFWLCAAFSILACLHLPLLRVAAHIVNKVNLYTEMKWPKQQCVFL